MRMSIITFKKLSKNKVVIFDNEGSQILNKAILKGIKYTVVYCRWERICVSFPLLFLIFKNAIHFLIKSKGLDIKRIPKCRWIGRLYKIYLFSCIEYVNPKVVITFIDNDHNFHWISMMYNHCEFFAVQNGHRNTQQIGSCKKHYHQHFFCFGNYDKHRYAKFGHVVDKYCPIGSLRAGYYRSRVKKKKKKKYDLAIVSQYTGKGFNIYSDSQRKELSRQQILNEISYKTASNSMHSFLVRYIEEYNLRAAVLMRHSLNYDKERNYYEEKYRGKAILFGRDAEKMTSYLVADESEMVVGFNSTLLAESFGLGKKVISINFSETDLWIDYDPMIMFTKPNYSLFKKRLNELRAEPYDEYRKRTKEYASYLMNYNPDCPPHAFIRKKILQYL